jgi:exonuclease III
MCKIIFLNIQSLRNKVHELESFLIDSDSAASVLCLDEHWLTNNECDALNIQNYILKFYYSRSQDGYGGYTLCVKFFFLNSTTLEVKMVMEDH